MGTFTNSFGNSFSVQQGAKVNQKAYVATDGNDITGTGTYANPYATVIKAISVADVSKKIIIKSGDYINLSIPFTTNHVIQGENRETTRLLYGTRITEGELVDGYTKVYKKSAITVQSYDYEMWQHDIIDVATLIPDVERLPIHRGLTHRMTSTKLTNVASIALVESSLVPVYYYDGTDLYFQKVDGSDLAVNPIIIPLFANGWTSKTIALENLSVLYAPLQISSCNGYMTNITAKYNNYTSIWATASSIIFTNCEAAGSHEDGFGYNLTSDCQEIDCWSHDNGDEGSSAHETVHINRTDGLYEHNIGGGITDVGSSTTNCTRTKCLRNGADHEIGIYTGGYIFTYYDVSGTNNGAAYLDHCIGIAYSAQATAGAAIRAYCYQCTGTVSETQAMRILPIASSIAVFNVTNSGFTVSANIETKGYSTDVVIEYGLTTAYGSTKTVTGSPSTSMISFSEAITDLTQFEEYHYRIKSINGGITEYSSDTIAYITSDYTLNAVLTSTGTGAGVSTLRIKASSDISITLDGLAKFYTDSGGTANESSIWNIVAGVLQTIYLKVPSGTANMLISDVSKIQQFGSISSDGWISTTNAASLNIAINRLFNLSSLRVGGTCTLTGKLPTNLVTLYLGDGTVNWTYSGALPIGLTSLHVQSTGVNWTYSGALPDGITSLWIIAGNMDWTYSGKLPSALNYAYVSGGKLNWTGLDFGGSSNFTTVLNLSSYRISKMSSADMVTLLTSMKNRVGALPATINIGDYADYASPPTIVTDAVVALKAVKTNVTTVTFGA